MWKHPVWRGGWNDAEAGMPSAEASGAICVQKLDDSRNSAIHIRYRISLRSSSLWEPRYPLLRVVCLLGAPVRVRILQGRPWSADSTHVPPLRKRVELDASPGGRAPGEVPLARRPKRSPNVWSPEWVCTIDSMIPPQVHLRRPCYDFSFLVGRGFKGVWTVGRWRTTDQRPSLRFTSRRTGRSDGRCVQRAGT